MMKRKIGKSAKIIGKRFILSDIIMINGRIQKHAKAQKPNFSERNLLPKSWAFSFAVENHSSTAVKNNFISESFTKIADSFIYT